MRAKGAMEWFAEEDWLLYASPLLPMWESAPTANYSISRYLWSLRELPGREHVQAFWFFYVPQRELAEVMLEAGARVTVVSPQATTMLEGLAETGRVRWERRAYRPGDVAVVGRWGSAARLPLNKCFLQQNQSDSGFETYFRG